MPDHEALVPAPVKLAAKRAFVRTMFQGYEAVLAVGLSANIIISALRGEVDYLTLAVTAAVTILAPPLAGLRSWLSITRNGIPDAYSDATKADLALLDDAERNAVVQDAWQRTHLGR